MVRLPVPMRIAPTNVSTSGANIYTFYRAGSADNFNSFTIGGITTNEVVNLLNSTEISGTSGDSGLVHINNNGALVAVSAEL